MSDTADEGMILKAFLEDPDFDVGELNSEIESYLQRIHVLFNEGKCFEAECSYTKAAVRLLKHTRILHVKGGNVRSIGAPVWLLQPC